MTKNQIFWHTENKLQKLPQELENMNKPITTNINRLIFPVCINKWQLMVIIALDWLHSTPTTDHSSHLMVLTSSISGNLHCNQYNTFNTSPPHFKDSNYATWNQASTSLYDHFSPATSIQLNQYHVENSYIVQFCCHLEMCLCSVLYHSFYVLPLRKNSTKDCTSAILVSHWYYSLVNHRLLSGLNWSALIVLVLKGFTSTASYIKIYSMNITDRVFECLANFLWKLYKPGYINALLSALSSKFPEQFIKLWAFDDFFNPKLQNPPQNQSVEIHYSNVSLLVPISVLVCFPLLW